jgi:hypothetical protein
MLPLGDETLGLHEVFYRFVRLGLRSGLKGRNACRRRKRRGRSEKTCEQGKQS